MAVIERLTAAQIQRSPFSLPFQNGQQQKSPRQPLFSRVKQLINQVLLNMGLQWGDFNWEDFTVLIRRTARVREASSLSETPSMIRNVVGPAPIETRNAGKIQ
jgi:hypothetical protein